MPAVQACTKALLAPPQRLEALEAETRGRLEVTLKIE